YAYLRRVGWQRREQRRARDRARLVAIYEGRRPWYHTVRRGEALASIAQIFATTPEQVRALNNLVGDRVRIGQTLLVKPFTKEPVPTPPGASPEYAPPPSPVVPTPAPAAPSRAPARR
ncbi:MAG: LysM peptidoglycan-binding domain-containing protein, partial [Gemmatimonadaceae bacterium]|nr:LysM peptidoglycan-binding domain-containing protein [Gemmatimonadaceae bacterium]